MRTPLVAKLPSGVLAGVCRESLYGVGVPPCLRLCFTVVAKCLSTFVSVLSTYVVAWTRAGAWASRDGLGESLNLAQDALKEGFRSHFLGLASARLCLWVSRSVGRPVSGSAGQWVSCVRWIRHTVRTKNKRGYRARAVQHTPRGHLSFRAPVPVQLAKLRRHVDDGLHKQHDTSGAPSTTVRHPDTPRTHLHRFARVRVPLLQVLLKQQKSVTRL